MDEQENHLKGRKLWEHMHMREMKKFLLSIRSTKLKFAALKFMLECSSTKPRMKQDDLEVCTQKRWTRLIFIQIILKLSSHLDKAQKILTFNFISSCFKFLIAARFSSLSLTAIIICSGFKLPTEKIENNDANCAKLERSFIIYHVNARESPGF